MTILTQAVDSCPTAFLIINQEGLIVETNLATAELFGYSKNELIGSPVEILVPQSARLVHKSHIKDFFAQPFSRRMAAGRTLIGKTKSGSEIQLKIGISFFEKDHQPFSVANIVDVTAESKMHALLESTQEMAKIGSWRVDLAQNKCTWSRTTYNIHELDPSQDISIEDAIHFYAKDHQPLIRECVARCLEHHLPWDIELKIITTSGLERWVHAIGRPIIENEKMTGIEGTFQDIHEQVTLQQELQNSNEELAQFSYRTSHDLKAPLVTVRGLCGALIEDLKQGQLDEVEKNARKIETHVENLETLISDILNLARADLKSTDQEEIHFEQIVSEITSRLEGVYSDSEIQIRTDIDSSIKLNLSKIRITQILENLVSNAIKYRDINKPVNEVIVSLKEKDGKIYLSVADNGIGIPKKFEPRMFKMFQRFHPKISHGSGLGMYIVKKHAEKLGAEITFQSSEKGTVFKLIFSNFSSHLSRSL